MFGCERQRVSACDHWNHRFSIHGTKSYARLRPSAGFHAASCRAACGHVSTPEATGSDTSSYV